MKTKLVKRPNLNNGEEMEIKYVITDDEFNYQIQEIYDDEEYGIYKKEGGVYLDLGANTGMATLYFTQFAKQIYSVEPNPDIYRTLVENTKHLNNVKTFNQAIGVEDNELMFFSEGNGDTFKAQTFFPHSEFSKGIMVDCVKLSTFFKQNNLEHIDVMKIDVEESEYMIFPDNDFGLVAPKIDVIIGEAHFQKTGGFPQIIPALLKHWGFETEFPKLKHPNMFRKFTYQNNFTGQKSEIDWPEETIFIAKKKGLK